MRVPAFSVIWESSRDEKGHISLVHGEQDYSNIYGDVIFSICASLKEIQSKIAG